ncbi:MAG: hypothetical protein QF464_02595, partial [Myxococcota bacterium]|nr:hypothetical protein [Myxococcota bacterium]
MKRLLFAACLFALGVVLTAAAPVRDHVITAEDYFSQVWLSSSAVSPDGKLVAYTEKRWNKDADKRLTEIWLTDTRKGDARRITFDGASKWGMQWSADSRWLYFAGTRKRAGAKGAPYDGKVQVWRMGLDGGEPTPVTRVAGGVHHFVVSADGDALYYTVDKEQVQAPWKGLKSAHGKVDYGHGVHDFSQLWVLDLRTWRSRQIADTGRVIVHMAVSPDEARIAAMTKPDDSAAVAAVVDAAPGMPIRPVGCDESEYRRYLQSTIEPA